MTSNESSLGKDGNISLANSNTQTSDHTVHDYLQMILYPHR